MSRTYLLRTEPRTTSSDLSQGLAARVYDALWTLGRQWQLGELLGEDAGTPVNATLQAEAALLGVCSRGPAGSEETYDPRAMPLEPYVEADAVRAASVWTLRRRIDLGREFLHALADAGLSAYAGGFLDACAFQPAPPDERSADPAAARLLDLAVGRIPDGQQLCDTIGRALDDGDPIPAPPVIAANDTGPVRDAAVAWYSWCKETLLEGDATASAWQADTLDYAFGVATSRAANALRLDAPEHRGGSLDWYSFDARPQPQPADFQPMPTLSGLPTGVRFRGMPNPRWWELEDAAVDFGSVDAGASDSARLALLEYGLVYANDFFAIPMRLAVGSLCRITSLIVNDTFGMRLQVAPAAHGSGRQGHARWSMFTLTERAPGQSGPSGVADAFFLPPVAPQWIADRPVEDVLLLRDEMANLAWAIERRYEGAHGLAELRAEQGMRSRAANPAPPEVDAIRYTLGTSVPDYWFPLVPVQTAGNVLLELRQMANRPATVAPLGRFLQPGTTLPDFAVPREGRQLLRDYAFTRWSNGVPLVWLRRRSRVGSGEGTSGLRFDIAEGAATEL